MAKKTRRGRRIIKPSTPADSERARAVLAEVEQERDEIIQQGREALKRFQARQAELAHLIAELKSARQERGISLAQLAERSGIGKSNLSRLENSAEPNPTLDTIRRYADAIDCQLSITISST